MGSTVILAQGTTFDLTIMLNSSSTAADDVSYAGTWVSWGKGMPAYPLTPSDIERALSPGGLVLPSPIYALPGAYRPALNLVKSTKAGGAQTSAEAALEVMVGGDKAWQLPVVVCVVQIRSYPCTPVPRCSGQSSNFILKSA